MIVSPIKKNHPSSPILQEYFLWLPTNFFFLIEKKTFFIVVVIIVGVVVVAVIVVVVIHFTLHFLKITA